jgi:hypothetical protein
MDALANQVKKIVAHLDKAQACYKKRLTVLPPAEWIVGGYIVNRKTLKLFSKGRLLSLFLGSIVLAYKLEDRSGACITNTWLG